MTDGISDSLIDEIVRRVVRALGPGAAPRPAAPAPSPQGAPPRHEAARGAPGRVWVTTETLAGRAGDGRSVSLAANEALTPAARDYAAARGLEVVRGEPISRAGPATSVSAGQVRPAVLTRTLGLVVHRPDAKVAAALAAAGRGGVVMRGFADDRCWMVNARAMCAAVAGGELAGGAVIDRYAAGPMALAGKFRGVRPVQGVSVGAVEAALRQFDANVLVIGHVPVSLYEIRCMIDRFASGRRMGRDRTALLDAIEELEGQA